MIMSYHNDSIAFKTLLKQNRVWEPFEIAPSSAAWVVMMPLGELLDVIDRIINLLPELVAQLIRYLRIHRGDLACIPRRTGMNNERLHTISYRPHRLRNTSLVTPTIAPESISAVRFSTSASSTQ